MYSGMTQHEVRQPRAFDTESGAAVEAAGHGRAGRTEGAPRSGHISHYRLRTHWQPFEQTNATHEHAFRAGTRFDDVLSLHLFDRRSRLLTMDAVERVEVAIRASWAHHMAMAHGAHGYPRQAHCREVNLHARMVESPSGEFERSRETFAQHYRAKYANPALPPVWMAAETMSFGSRSKLHGGLKRHADRQAIAKPFGLDERVFASFAHHMSHVRNTCAHHGRLWNRPLHDPHGGPQIARAAGRSDVGRADDQRLHDTLSMLDHMLAIVAPGATWTDRVCDLVRGCALADPRAMGFPADWGHREVWAWAMRTGRG